MAIAPGAKATSCDHSRKVAKIAALGADPNLD